MLIDEKITLKIASLAKLELKEQEVKEYSKDITNILKWMEERFLFKVLKKVILLAQLFLIMLKQI